MDAAIELKHIEKAFRLTRGRARSLKSLLLSRRAKPELLWALRGVDLSISPGETVAVIGRNGSGKSTMLGIVGKIYRPTAGKVSVQGRVSALLDLGAGFHPELTGLENIYLNGAILGIRTRDMKDKVQRIVEFAGLEQFIQEPIKTYSKGMVMRLGFAVAVQVDPDVLLVDEVLAVGDEEFQMKCYRKIEEFQQAGKTIVFVSHDLDAVRQVASRAVWLDEGRVVADGPAGSVVDQYCAGVTRSGEVSDVGTAD